MTKKILIAAFFCFLLFFLARNKTLIFVRQKIEESYLKLSQFGVCSKSNNKVNSLLSVKQLSELKALRKENQVLRKQLGSIPERRNLYPALVIFSDNKNYYLRFNYFLNKSLVGNLVILEDFYVGKIIRQGAEMLVVEKPTVSGFQELGVSQSGERGVVKSEFNENLYFEVSWESKIKKNEFVYLVNKEYSDKFILGKVLTVQKDERRAVKKAILEYLPLTTDLSTVFVVL